MLVGWIAGTLPSTHSILVVIFQVYLGLKWYPKVSKWYFWIDIYLSQMSLFMAAQQTAWHLVHVLKSCWSSRNSSISEDVYFVFSLKTAVTWVIWCILLFACLDTGDDGGHMQFTGPCYRCNLRRHNPRQARSETSAARGRFRRRSWPSPRTCAGDFQGFRQLVSKHLILSAINCKSMFADYIHVYALIYHSNDIQRNSPLFRWYIGVQYVFKNFKVKRTQL